MTIRAENPCSLIVARQVAIFIACTYAAVVLAQANDYSSLSYVQFQNQSFTVAENETNALITVIRTGDFRQQTSVDYQVSDGSAVAGEDYKPAGGQLVFAPFEHSKSFLVAIISDNLVETNETVRLTLLNPARNAIIIQPEATLTITDAPAQPAAAPWLAVGPCEAGLIALSWPGDRLDCFLEQTDDPANSWTMLSATPYEMEGRLIVEQPASNHFYFYRLRTK